MNVHLKNRGTRDISVMNIHRNYLFKNSPVLTSFLPVSGQCFHGFLLYAFQMLAGVHIIN